MPDILLTEDEFNQLKAIRDKAQELVTTIPYITAAGGTVMRQNIAVQALATSLEAAAGLNMDKPRKAKAGKS